MATIYDQLTTANFAMVPRSEVERSVFNSRHSHKTTFDAGYLVPVFCEEVLPGDSFRGNMHAVARLATPIRPFMDDLTFETFFFFVPNRLLWDNWPKLMGERTDPGDSIDFSVPMITSPQGGYAANSVYDYFGLPTVNQVLANKTVEHQALPLRAYNLIYNEWFRDENLINSVPVNRGDGPDSFSDYTLLKRGKRHDYFTSCLPWPQKGDDVELPLGDQALIRMNHISGGNPASQDNYFVPRRAGGGAYELYASATPGTAGSAIATGNTYNLYADLDTATAATINSIRRAFQVQRLLERDARGGTRYTEMILSHFGVRSPDMRLQRPEYIGGGSTPMIVNGVQQTSSTDATTPQGNLSANVTMVTEGGHGFRVAATEHGFIIGLMCVRAELSYQQGLRRMWSRETRYDYYWPAFAHLGEQAVLSKEIYCDGSDDDQDVFGYQERYGEYRYFPSKITGLFRSTDSAPLDVWHLSQKFANRPTLNQTFIEEAPPIDRVIAVPSQTGKQFYFDSLFQLTAVRPMPMYGVPGMIDRF